MTAPCIDRVRLVAVALALAALVPTVAHAQSADLERARLLELLETATRAGSAEAAAAVLELAEPEPWLPPDDVLQAYAEARGSMPPGLARDLLAYRELRLHEALGQLDARDALLADQGYLTTWSVIGPFPNEGMSGLARRFGPELDGVGPSEYEGRTTTIRWRALQGVSESGYLDLYDVVQPEFDAVAYVAADVSVARSTDAVLGLAVDGAYRVWLNGEPLVEQPDHLGGFAVRDEVPVRLARGRNQLLIKIAVDDTAMGLHARLTTPDGRGLRVDAGPAAAPGIEARESEVWSGPSEPADRLTAPTRAARDRLTVAYVVQALQPADPSEPWRLEGVVPGGPEYTPWDHVRAASLEREHWKAMLWLDAAAQASTDPWIRLAWVRSHRREPGAGPRLAAASGLRELLDAGAAPASVWMEWASMLAEQGFEQAAAAARSRVYEATGGALPSLWPMLASLAHLERRDEQVALAAELLARDARSTGAVERLARHHLAAGETDAAVAAVNDVIAVLPLDAEPRLLLARLLRGAGDLDGAVAAIDQLIALAPGDAGAWEERGRLLLEAGDSDAATAAWEAALARAPQNAALRDELERVRPAAADAWADLRVADDELRRRADAATSTTGAVALVDQRFVELHANGLATAWNQLAWRVDTRQAADMLRRRSVTYTPDAELVELRALRVLKADGSVVEAYDVDDYNPQRGPAAMYFDVRVRAWSVAQLEPGDVLVHEYTVDDVAYRNLFDDYYGDLWFAQGDHPVVDARYGIRAPATRTLHDNRDQSRFGTWDVRREGATQVLEYRASDLPAVPPEGAAPGATEVAEFVSVSTATSWPDLATWYWQLVEDQLVVSPEIERTVRELTATASTTLEKVQAIYGYVVRNTRYVGLEFGIHGYRPYRTTECFARRFGDCKDTASLIKVMLAVAGIDAHLVLVRTRDRGRVGAEPPSLAVFNHAIAYVPELDLFLDGTAGFSGALELPPGDQGATALIVRDGAGGELVRIPVLPAAQSVDETIARVSLVDEAATSEFDLSWTGAFAAGGRRLIESTARLDERLEDQLGASVPGIEVTSLEASDPTAIDQPVTFALTASGGQFYASVDGAVVLHPFLDDSNLVRRLAGAEARELPLAFPHAFTIRQRYRFEIPEAWLPDDVLIEEQGASPYGRWSVRVAWSRGGLEAESEFVLDAVDISPDEYGRFRAFVAEADAAIDRVVRFSEGGAS